MITLEDCLPGCAPKYPGLWSKDNPNGSTLTSEEYTAKHVYDWVKHFGDSENYQNTYLSNKTRYLSWYLREIRVERSGKKWTDTQDG